MMHFKCILNLINFTRCWKSDSTRTLFYCFGPINQFQYFLRACLTFQKVQTKIALTKCWFLAHLAPLAFPVNYVVRILIDFNYLFLVEVRTTDWRHLDCEWNIMNLEVVWYNSDIITQEIYLWNIWIIFFSKNLVKIK
jgi:hypothetical protein